jgi:hypothetical protein
MAQELKQYLVIVAAIVTAELLLCYIRPLIKGQHG